MRIDYSNQSRTLLKIGELELHTLLITTEKKIVGERNPDISYL
jgi:hypothetical protein